ncbi:hypothetical protein CORC01_00656 [Colletotrichum orchidophilum]|uniref:Cell surface protein n=1 Tax=Colletotrichum orchidophilum TaxID=1209926 RepID=A0A1G4BSS9_9PEZI|nr:uncharacterized protein CORC01_00656 [Colletotrichum orchidophilum]OHF04317.1 hypothetical protein CORC01_00656 [Colletotrichum orchidophilum]
MGLGAKIKNALHSDDQPQKTTYEGDQPPGAFPSDSTTAGTTKHNTTTTGGYTGGTTGSHTTGTTGTTGTHTTGTHHDHRGGPTSGLTGTTHGTTQDATHATTTGHTGGLTGSNTAGYSNVNDPDGVHGPHAGRAANKLDPRVDSDRDHRGAPGVGLSGTHRPHDSGVEVGQGVGRNKPYKGEYLANAERANAQDPYWGDVGRDGATVNKDLPLRPNESGIGRGGPQAVGGGHYNPAASTHHDPASGVDRSVEGRDFTHPNGPNTGVGGASGDPYSGVHSAAHNPQAALSGGNASDPYDTRVRDRDMGRERTGHGAAGAGIGAGVGAGVAVAAGQAAHRHHRDDMHESGHGGTNTVGSVNSPVAHNTHGTDVGVTGTHAGGVHGHHRSSLTGNEPGVPKSSMLDPYNEAPTATLGTHSAHGTHGTHGTHGNVAGTGGVLGGHTGSSSLNQGTQSSHVPGTSGLGPNGMGPDHYGPGHEGAKVFHTCTKCGEDNDISRYFKKDAVYRMN